MQSLPCVWLLLKASFARSGSFAVSGQRGVKHAERERGRTETRAFHPARDAVTLQLHHHSVGSAVPAAAPADREEMGIVRGKGAAVVHARMHNARARMWRGPHFAVLILDVRASPHRISSPRHSLPAIMASSGTNIASPRAQRFLSSFSFPFFVIQGQNTRFMGSCNGKEEPTPGKHRDPGSVSLSEQPAAVVPQSPLTPPASSATPPTRLADPGPRHECSGDVAVVPASNDGCQNAALPPHMVGPDPSQEIATAGADSAASRRCN
jgi:hypothetical protein